MKNILFVLIIFNYSSLLAQVPQGKKAALEKVFVNENVSTHFIFSEPITYVDLSANKDKIIGDLPVTNVLRVKPVQISDRNTNDLGIVTIVGQKYMAQFQLVYTSPDSAIANKPVSRGEGIGLLNPEVSLSIDEMKAFSLDILNEKATYHSVKTKKYKLEVRLNNVYTIGDYFFIDVSVNNNTNIKYDIDQIRFKIEDKKVVKATNFQQFEIKPEFQLYDQRDFKKQYRNVFVFKKFTFPDEKIFSIELSEKQISGRTAILRIDYTDVLNADTL